MELSQEVKKKFICQFLHIKAVQVKYRKPKGSWDIIHYCVTCGKEKNLDYPSQMVCEGK